MKWLLPCILAFCAPMAAFTQDITGLWTGTMFNDSTKQVLKYEVVIKKSKGKYSGLSHTWFLINEKEYYGIKKIRVHIAPDGKIVMEDGELIENNYPVSPLKNVRQLNVLDLTKQGEEIVLDGIFVTNQTREYRELTGHINVKRSNSTSQSNLKRFLETDAAYSFNAK